MPAADRAQPIVQQLSALYLPGLWLSSARLVSLRGTLCAAGQREGQRASQSVPVSPHARGGPASTSAASEAGREAGQQPQQPPQPPQLAQPASQQQQQQPKQRQQAQQGREQRAQVQQQQRQPQAQQQQQQQPQTKPAEPAPAAAAAPAEERSSSGLSQLSPVRTHSAEPQPAEVRAVHAKELRQEARSAAEGLPVVGSLSTCLRRSTGPKHLLAAQLRDLECKAAHAHSCDGELHTAGRHCLNSAALCHQHLC